jgi:hypothetical protein
LIATCIIAMDFIQSTMLIVVVPINGIQSCYFASGTYNQTVKVHRDPTTGDLSRRQHHDGTFNQPQKHCNRS